MARQQILLASLNRGEVSLLALARTDIEKLRLSAQSQINFLPRVLGPAMLRPGTNYIGDVLDNAPCKVLPFVAAFSDTALLEMTANIMRIWVDDELVTRAAVATTIPNFSGAWTLATTGTAVATASGGVLEFSSVNFSAVATATYALSVAAPDQQTEHALRFTVTGGPVLFSIGSVAGLADIFVEDQPQTLDNGVYSMAFTPGMATVYVQFAAIALPDNANTLTQSIPTEQQLVTVTNISIEGPGVLELPTPWGVAQIGTPSVTPSTLRITPSGDVVFVAAAGVPQQQINRYTPTSWSIVKYRSVKGPMGVVPTNASISLTPSVFSGNGMLTASGNLFSPDAIGTLFRLFSNGQTFQEELSFANTYTDAIEVTGVSYVSNVDGSGNVFNTATVDRSFAFIISGTWSGTLTLQRSFTSATTGFADYLTYTTNQSEVVISDGLNNEIVWYRIGFNPTAYTSGTAVIFMAYSGGGNYGVAHVTGYVSPTQVEVEILVPMWGFVATSDWLQSQWSAAQGYPTCCALHEGRLWWSGADRWWGSVSDDYTNFDYDATGDAAPINQSVGQGPIANINWMVSIDHLLAGADTSIITAMSDAIESPLTPSNFILRRSVTNGAYPIQAVAVDQRVVYLDQSGRRLYELIYDIRLYNYKPTDLTRLNPDIGIPQFTDMAVQRQPDTRILLVRTDGILVSLIYDPDDEVQAFWRCQLGGVVESIAVLPGPLEDQVYVVVNRTINGHTVRYIEKFARIDECQCAPISKCVDACLVYQGTATNVLAGFGHLVGQTVCIWGTATNAPESLGGPAVTGDLGTAVVSLSGTVTLPDGIEVTTAVVGLGYSAEFISAKLAYASNLGSALNQQKRVDHLGFVLTATHCQGLRYGAWTPNDPSNVPNGIFTPPAILDAMPIYEYGAPVTANTIWPTYDSKQIEFPCEVDSDVRLYIQAASPRPATINSISFSIESN
jgi:hypothetical protein